MATDRAAVLARNAELRERARAVGRRNVRLRVEAMLLCQRIAMAQLDRELEEHLRRAGP